MGRRECRWPWRGGWVGISQILTPVPRLAGRPVLIWAIQICAIDFAGADLSSTMGLPGAYPGARGLMSSYPNPRSLRISMITLLHFMLVVMILGIMLSLILHRLGT